MFKKYLLTTCVLAFAWNTTVSAGGPENPLANLDYTMVSDLKKVHARYKTVLQEQGCLENVIDENDPEVAGIALAPVQTLKAYQGECLEHLAAVRKTTLLKPAFEALTLTGLITLATTIVVAYNGFDSIGSGLSISSAIFNSAFNMKDGVTAWYNYKRQPKHPVDKQERAFVTNQCYIPQNLWPIMVEKLMIARQNPFEQRDALRFLKFAMGSTVFKPIPQPQLEVGYQPEKTILRKLRTFFKKYEPFKNPLQKAMLRANIKSFIKRLMGEQIAQRPILLYGPGGIGKTFLSKKLKTWIEEEFHNQPNTVAFETFKITTPEELEGSGSEPGIFLQVLRNKCTKGAVGSVVILDEANWINRPEFEASAKRVFNGGLTELSTNYLGEEELKMPPVLSIAASNHETEDKNLASRFDNIEFPMPKKETLAKYAVKLFKKLKGGADPSVEEKAKLTEAITNAVSFRDIESIVPALYDMLEESDIEAGDDSSDSPKANGLEAVEPTVVSSVRQRKLNKKDE